jgi:hypothetical protein
MDIEPALQAAADVVMGYAGAALPVVAAVAVAWYAVHLVRQVITGDLGPSGRGGMSGDQWRNGPH